MKLKSIKDKYFYPSFGNGSGFILKHIIRVTRAFKWFLVIANKDAPKDESESVIKSLFRAYFIVPVLSTLEIKQQVRVDS